MKSDLRHPQTDDHKRFNYLILIANENAPTVCSEPDIYVDGNYICVYFKVLMPNALAQGRCVFESPR